MKVKDLIEKLRGQDPEARVFLSHPSHDYHRTQLAGPVARVTGHEAVKWSEQHRQHRIARDEDLYYADGVPLPPEEMEDEGIILDAVMLTFSGGQ